MQGNMEASAGENGQAGELRKLSVLIPVYNERWTLRAIIQRVLAAPVPLELELIVVDDGSTDGSWELLLAMAAEDDRIKPHQHERNCGKGSAVRTAMEKMTGDVAVIQDADLEYDPQDYAALLPPILDGRADAVFGSRFAGHERRVLTFWHSLANWGLTQISNMLNDLNLTDMETCYKMVRVDVLRQLRLTSTTFTIEPELTCRLAQLGARVYEVPISYDGRSYAEGKKIGLKDAFKAVWQMFNCRFLDTRFTDHAGLYQLRSSIRSVGYHRWTLDLVKDYLGKRLLETSSGVGTMSQLLLNRERLVMVADEPLYRAALQRRFCRRDNATIEQADLNDPQAIARRQNEPFDTILCTNALQRLESDDQTLKHFEQALAPGGHCIVVAPAAAGDDQSPAVLKQKMEEAGLEVVHNQRFGRLGTIAGAVSGRRFRPADPSRWQMRISQRLLPVARLLERLLPVPGMTLILVGRKPAAQQQRQAA